MRRPIPNGFRNFSARYRARFGQEPVRTAALAYDAVALIAALVKTQGQQRFSEQVLTNASGFAGIDGIFRFRPDGTNERGLAVMRVTPSGRAADQSGAEVVRRRRLKDQAARSATTASSNGNPDWVTRKRPFSVVSIVPPSRRNEMRAGIEQAARQCRVARKIDAFGEPQAHQEEFIGLLARRQLFIDDEAMTLRSRRARAKPRGAFRFPLRSDGRRSSVGHARRGRCRHSRDRASK